MSCSLITIWRRRDLRALDGRVTDGSVARTAILDWDAPVFESLGVPDVDGAGVEICNRSTEWFSCAFGRSTHSTTRSGHR